jgi:hypothetical protein
MKNALITTLLQSKALSTLINRPLYLSGFLMGLCKPDLGTALRLSTKGFISEECVMGTRMKPSPFRGSGMTLEDAGNVHSPFTANPPTNEVVNECYTLPIITTRWLVGNVCLVGLFTNDIHPLLLILCKTPHPSLSLKQIPPIKVK